MARSVYGGTPADFVVSPGAKTDVLDEAGVPVNPGVTQGWTALLPSFAGTYDVWDADEIAGGTQLTDLLDENGGAITTVPFDGTFASLGMLPRFSGPDLYEGDVYLVPTGAAPGTKRLRVAPSMDPAWTRLAAIEAAVAALNTAALADWSDTPATDGQVPVYSTSLGQWVPSAAAGTGTVTSVAGVVPVSGDVPAAALSAALGAATDADMDAVFESALFMVAQTGPGYPSHPAGVIWKGHVGDADPGVGVFKIWLKPKPVTP